MKGKENLGGELKKVAVVTISDGKIVGDDPRNTPATFEQAIAATGFGKFNILLMTLIALPSAWATMMATTTTSFILPIAQCDLDLTLQNKGLLNGITYFGMISSGFFWGYLSDTLGRKKLLVIGFLIDGCFVILSGISNSFSLMLFAKYMNGFTISGPFSVITTTLSEFHSAKYRARILMTMGLLYSTANILLPTLGWIILPLEIEISLLNGFLLLHSWNIFIIVCSIPSLTSGMLHMILPESPKFLMTVSRNDEALKVFKKIYHWNTGKNPDSFPVKMLIDENQQRKMTGFKHGGFITENRTKIQALKEGFQQIKPLFFPPHGLRLLLVSVIQLGVMLGLNTLRLWLPQIFSSINDYESLHHEDGNLCTMLNTGQQKNVSEVCSVNRDNSVVYINQLIVAVATIAAYVLVTCVINKIGKKRIFLTFGLTGSIFMFLLYASTNSTFAVTTSSVFIAVMSVLTNICLTIVVDLFPTSLRTVTVSFVMIVGRSGALFGNVLFPYLLEMGCFPPFATLGFLVLISALLSTLLPGTDLKPLE